MHFVNYQTSNIENTPVVGLVWWHQVKNETPTDRNGRKKSCKTVKNSTDKRTQFQNSLEGIVSNQTFRSCHNPKIKQYKKS